MAHTKSAKKNYRKSEKRRLWNKARAAEMKTWVKKVQAAVGEKKLDEAKSLLPIAAQKIDKAAKRNVIHRNTASRKKSQLARSVAVLEKTAK
jgi:small subunit ribosomal protein S20